MGFRQAELEAQPETQSVTVQWLELMETECLKERRTHFHSHPILGLSCISKHTTEPCDARGLFGDCDGAGSLLLKLQLAPKARTDVLLVMVAPNL